ncbi:MAG: xanthine dehydrogenase family protein subunit M [Planctomycetia bacterium]|nr:xanthine dehydrogenase family protein subunit M [Planctomycetia bacterium]
MKDIEYAAARSVDEAVGLLAARGDKARILAGGTDILVQLREGLRDADLIVDVKKIPELVGLSHDAKRGLRLGASTPCYRIYRDAKICAAYPALADAARIIGGWQIQSRASIGGNLCNSSPAADSIPALIAHDARCVIAGPSGRRTVPVAEFCTAPGRNVLARGELLVTLEFPPVGDGEGARYLRFIPRNEMDIAVVGAGVWVKLNAAKDTIAAARIGLAAVAPTPLPATEVGAWLAGKPATAATFAEAGDRARRLAKPISDMRSPAEYRLHIVGVLVTRALAGAVDRARGIVIGHSPNGQEH